MRRMLALLGALGLLVSTTMIVRSATDSEPQPFCQLYGLVSPRKVELDGQLFSIARAEEEAELRHGCAHYVGPIILPNCDAWDEPKVGPPRRIGMVGPFSTDGTCDGSGGGTRLDGAPTEIISSTPRPG